MNGGNLNVRKTPYINNYNRLYQMMDGTDVKMIYEYQNEKNETWYYINGYSQTDNPSYISGWVMGQYLLFQ